MLATEIVASILSNIPPSKKRFPTELREIHTIMFGMKSKGLDILNNFYFDLRGTFPYSRSLDQAFSNLETAGVLPRVNPHLDKYDLSGCLKLFYKNNISKKLTARNKKEVKEIADKLADIALIR